MLTLQSLLLPEYFIGHQVYVLYPGWLEEDAVGVLKFMASNGLLANPTKTTLMVINNKNKDEPTLEVKVGEALIKQEKSAKL